MHAELPRDGADRPLQLAHAQRRGRAAGDQPADGARRSSTPAGTRATSAGARCRADTDELRVATQGFETDSGLLNDDCSAIPIMIFMTDHQATTIDRVVAAVKDFREDERRLRRQLPRASMKTAQKAAEKAGEDYAPTRPTCAWRPATSA